MRLILTILISICLATPAYAFWGVWRQESGGTCSTPEGNIGSEGFEAPGQEWAGWVNESGTPDYAYDISSFTTGDDSTVNCDYGVRANSTSGVLAERGLGSARASLYVEYSFYVDSYSMTGVNTTIAMASATNQANQLWFHRLRESAGSLQTYTNNVNYVTISIDTWYYVEVYGADASTSCTMKVGTTYGGSDIANETFTCADITVDPVALMVGANNRIIDISFGYVAAGTSDF